MGFPFLSTALISGLNGFGDEEEYTLFLENRIGGRLQLPDDMKLRTRSFLYFRHHFFFWQQYIFALLFWKPLYIPSTDSFDVPHDKLKRVKVECGDSIEAHIEKNQGPFEEGISGISC